VTRPRRAGRCAGFTLLELLIAIALMAVLAVLGWRGLDSVLSARERISMASDELRALSVTFTQVEEDLRRSWPVRLLDLPEPPIAFVTETAEGQPVLQVVRELPPEPGGARLQRVYYRLRAGVLERGFAAWTGRAAEAGAGEAASRVTWQPLIEGVQELQMRAWVPGQGWVPAAALLWRPGSARPAGLVTGVEISLARGGERLLRILPVKD
jgi:general secretion pathway protein J